MEIPVKHATIVAGAEAIGGCVRRAILFGIMALLVSAPTVLADPPKGLSGNN
jgi:hypothetical protein